MTTNDLRHTARASASDGRNTPRPIDEAMLAAFIDGKLSPLERVRVLAHLERSPEDRAWVAEAAGVLNDLGATCSTPSTPSAETAGARQAASPSRRLSMTRPAMRVVGWALAAGVAGVVIIPLAQRRGAADGGVSALVAWYDGRTRFDEGWTTPPWSGTRGEHDALAPRARDFRLGVRSVDLRLAGRGGDSAAFRRWGRELSALAAALPAGGASAYEVEALTRNGVATDDDVAPVLARIQGQTEAPEWYELGAWTEASRVALNAGVLTDRTADRALDAGLAKLLEQFSPPVTTDERARVILARLRRLRDAGQGDRLGNETLAAALDSTLAEASR